MAKSLSHTCDPKEIIADLKDKGFKVVNVFNKTKYKTKEPLDMFVLSFDNTEDINKIYNIDAILNTKITIEALKLPKLIPQCGKCQSYNHTKNYCSKEPRCVRCAGKHESKNCDKPSDSNPKCVNCGEEHPASYRGCIVAKELQKLRENKTKRSLVQNNKTTTIVASAVNKTVSNTNLVASNNPKANPKLYSQVIQQRSQSSEQTKQYILTQILIKLENIETQNKVFESRLLSLEENFSSVFE